ncbi:MAG: aminoacyl-histidine dipeptidase [Paludibacteraceae bacterium]|nr:aminoacyl-histidine dipeptidase [Paludibacteraceae bacterium]
MNSILDLEPKELWFYFNEICQIPHPSGKEEKIGKYLIDFAEKRGLEASMDKVGNVLIRKNASAGYESAPSLALQAHMDMVCEKNEGTLHDFEKDPIQPYIDGDWVKAKGTTLGADDGIGVATMLAILDSKTIKHPALECLITVDEERGLTGAQHVEKDWLKSNYLLNLDSEDDGRFCIGCAGGIDTIAFYSMKEMETPKDVLFIKLKVSGLLGGHSGDDINKGRGNAIKILSRFLWNEKKQYAIYLKQIQGGNLHNAIPREASATIAIPFKDKENIRISLNQYIATIESEYPEEPQFSMDLESTDASSTVLNQEQTNSLINALYSCPHGVIDMSREIEGLPETSTNLASIKMPDETTIIISTSQRSSVESKKHNIKNKIEAIFMMSGAEKVTHSDGYPGWKPNLNSRIKDIVVKSYVNLFEKEPVVTAIHAGLECGLFSEKYPNLDMISIGPDIISNHSPAERCSIPSVARYWDHVIKILEDFK